ncbi:pyroglutamyl-peptidase I [Halostagnicola sp. A-GB9-2]|uniref:pyroglutamyl-peptidase I n=1 Tax=Halostagnicola sp. A-GB9-2 TaxID=3048066 RepID=UPI0024BFD2BF|nr:pyroglutamyl-peptidase I [Halostagnicola sp. A-GB9-2]MDJ1432247.1 pyroglutamyl-peptidase I [Halostagnicola sp. A-GB9-2]
MSEILLTGYEPFGEFETNPARRLATALDGTTIGDATVVGREFPVVFDRLQPALEAAIDEHDPDIVCSLGLAAGRNTLSLERVGINCRDTTTSGIPDNADREVADEPVVEDGPAAYFATLPLREMKTAMVEASVPTTRSSDAGTHLCNNLLYTACYLAETSACPAEFDSGFIHVPFSHEQAARRDDGEPSMSVETMERGLVSGLEVAVERTTRP